MGIVCPNVSHPDYKKLVEKYGKDKAIEMFIDNSYEMPKVEAPKGVVERVLGKISFPFNTTMDLIRDNPKVAAKIIDDLNRDHPAVRIAKDRILDKDGKYTEFKPGEKGMHYRNAFESVVAWSNDASLETPPHEYAHHYIEMFYDSPLVQAAIEKYGGIEPVAELMGRHYAKKKLSNSAVNFINDFWQMVKKYFGNVDIGYDLSEAFYNNKKLMAKQSAGLATMNYQKMGSRGGVRKRYAGGYDMADQGFNKLPSSVDLTVDEREAMYDAKARETLRKAGITIGNYDSAKPDQAARKITNHIANFKARHAIVVGGKSVYKGSLIDTRLLHDLDDWLYKEGNMEKLTNASFNNSELPQDTALDTDKKYIDILAEMQVADDYKIKLDNSIQDGKGNYYNKQDAIIKATKEIERSQKKRDQMYDKYIKFKPLKKLVKKVEKALLYQLNGRLISKYISGSSSSFLYQSFYKALNNAENERNNMMIEFNEKLMQDSFASDYGNWSYFKGKSTYEFNDINDLDTETYKFETLDGNPRNIKITKAEMLSVYLMDRQDRSRLSMEGNGIILNDKIEGRDIPVNETYKMSPETIKEISDKVKNDPKMEKVISGIDSAMRYMEGNVSETYFHENGIPFTTQKDYFPVYGGSKNFDERKHKSSIDDFRSLNLSLGEGHPIRIVDPIQVVNSYKVASATYSAMAIPIANNKKIIERVEDQFHGTKEEPYIKAMKTIINQLEDRSHLYSGQGEQEWEQVINKLTSNFAVAVLGMNLPVMAKQSVSFLTAMEAIDGKHLRKAGFGSRMYPVINPMEIFKALEMSNPTKGNSILPMEWNLDTNSGTFALMKEHSPALRARLDGMVNREMAEALMNQDQGSDIVTIPGFKKPDGTHFKISKTRLMEGIRVFDAVTVQNLWKAAEFEAVEEFGLKRGTPEFYEHVAIRTEEIVSETQPNNNITDRSTLSNLPNPLARFVTQFSSATSKIAQMQIDGVITYLADPTTANLQNMLQRSANIMITTSLTMTIMDALRTALLHGYDDDDELMKDILIAGTVNGLSYYYGIGQIIKGVGSQLDDKPFYQSLQHPVNAMGQDLIQVLSNAGKGNLVQAATKAMELTMKSKGISTNPLVSGRALIRKYSDD